MRQQEFHDLPVSKKKTKEKWQREIQKVHTLQNKLNKIKHNSEMNLNLKSMLRNKHGDYYTSIV